MFKYGVLSSPYFPIFSPNTGKCGPEKTPYLDTFHAVIRLRRASALGLISSMSLDVRKDIICIISLINLYLELKASVLTPLEDNDKGRKTTIQN